MKIRIIEIETDEPLIEKGIEDIFKQQPDNVYDPCIGCPNNKPGQINICHCTLPYMNQIT